MTYPPEMNCMKVHVIKDDTKTAIDQPKKKRRIAVFKTYTITANNPSRQILGRSYNRVMCYVTSTLKIVVGATQADVLAYQTIQNDGAVVNLVVGTNPIAYQIETTEEAWAAAFPGASIPGDIFVQEVLEVDC